jgi:hypothetical protein
LARIRKEVQEVVEESGGLQADLKKQQELHQRVGQDLARVDELLGQVRQTHEANRRIAGAIRTSFQRIGGGEGLVQALARLKALEAAVEGQRVENEEVVGELRAEILAGWRRTHWRIALACAVTLAVALASSLAMALFLR